MTAPKLLQLTGIAFNKSIASASSLEARVEIAASYASDWKDTISSMKKCESLRGVLDKVHEPTSKEK